MATDDDTTQPFTPSPDLLNATIPAPLPPPPPGPETDGHGMTWNGSEWVHYGPPPVTA